MQVALSGTSFSLLQRVGAIVRNGAKLFAVGTTSSLVGSVATNAFINARKAVEHSAEDEIENAPVLSTSVGYGNIPDGGWCSRTTDLGAHASSTQVTVERSLLCCSNRWVDYARLIGIQNAH